MARPTCAEEEPTDRELAEAECDYLSSLLHEEADRLHDIRHHLSLQIGWKKLVRSIFEDLDDKVHAILFDTQKAGEKTPEEQLSRSAQDYLRDEKNNGSKEELRVRYVRLLLVKKLIGALKTAANKALAEIPVLTEEASERLLSTLSGADEAEDDIVAEIDRRLEDFGPTWIGPQEISEEEGRLLSDMSEQEIAELFAVPEKREGSEEEEEETGECQHEHTTTLYMASVQPPVTQCKLCHTVLNSETEMGKHRKGKHKHKKSGKCSHPEAMWVPGQEGKQAYCDVCKGIIPDPGRYKWSDNGLEPYQDDPSKDEIIIIAEYMAEKAKEVQE